MKRIILTTAAVLLLATTAHAEDHTASWFAVHLAEMNAVLNACRDDPGHMKDNPNCPNAEQGMLEKDVAEGQAELARERAAMNAQQEAGWRAHPQMLIAQLKVCNGIPPQARAQFWTISRCPEAFALAKQMLKAEQH